MLDQVYDNWELCICDDASTKPHVRKILEGYAHKNNRQFQQRARLRRSPEIWESLDAIEIRGHTDPHAVRNPYSTNMVGSQQRALGVLLFLVGPSGLSEPDRIELQRLAVVSGVSFARPPTACPERSRECYPKWRRVEIRPVLSESLRRGDWSRTVQDARNAVGSTPNRNLTRNSDLN